MEEEEDLSFENLTLVVNNYPNKNFSDIVITDLPTRFVSNLHQVFGKRKYMVITLFVPNDDTLKARVLNPTRSSEYRDWAQAIELNKSIMNHASLPQEIKLNSEELNVESLISCRIPDDCIDSPSAIPSSWSDRADGIDRVLANHTDSRAMLIALHKNARTTPAVRVEIAASNETASVPARRALASPSRRSTRARSVRSLQIARTRPSAFEPCSHPHRKPWWFTCGVPCCCRWMACWPSRGSSSALMSHLRPGPMPAPPWGRQSQCPQTP